MHLAEERVKEYSAPSRRKVQDGVSDVTIRSIVAIEATRRLGRYRVGPLVASRASAVERDSVSVAVRFSGVLGRVDVAGEEGGHQLVVDAEAVGAENLIRARQPLVQGPCPSWDDP